MKNQEGWRKGCGEMRFPATAMQCLGAAFLEWQIHCRTTSSSHHFITKNLFRTPLQNLKFHCKTYQSKKAFAFHTNINFLGRNYNHLRHIYRSSPLLGSYEMLPHFWWISELPPDSTRAAPRKRRTRANHLRPPMVRPKTHLGTPLERHGTLGCEPWDHWISAKRCVALREFLVDIHPLKIIFNVGHSWIFMDFQ